MTGDSLLKANHDEQAKFLEHALQPRINEAKKGERLLYFVDASHFVLQSYLYWLQLAFVILKWPQF